MEDEKEKPFGRPTKYKPEYCSMLIEHMEGLLSFESFAGVVLISRQTLYNWLDQHPDFLDAKRTAEGVGKVSAEKYMVQAMKGEVPCNPAISKQVAANIWKWTDRVEEKVTKEVKRLVIEGLDEDDDE